MTRLLHDLNLAKLLSGQTAVPRSDIQLLDSDLLPTVSALMHYACYAAMD